MADELIKMVGESLKEQQTHLADADFHKLLSLLGTEDLPVTLGKAVALLPPRDRDPPVKHDVLTVAAYILNAKVAVDLGTGYGYSGLAFLRALKRTGGMLYTVDTATLSELRKSASKHPPHLKNLEIFIKEIEEGHAIFLNEDSVKVGRDWKGDIDILSCSTGGSHVLAELKAWDHVKPKLIFVCDTLLTRSKMSPMFYEVYNWCKANNKKLHNFPVRQGIGMIYQ